MNEAWHVRLHCPVAMAFDHETTYTSTEKGVVHVRPQRRIDGMTDSSDVAITVHLPHVNDNAHRLDHSSRPRYRRIRDSLLIVSHSQLRIPAWSVKGSVPLQGTYHGMPGYHSWTSFELFDPGYH